MRARCFSGGRRDCVVGSGGGMRPLRRGREGVVGSCEFLHGEVVAKERSRRRDMLAKTQKLSLVTSSHRQNISFQENTWENKHFILSILTRRARPAVPDIVPTCTPRPAPVVRITRRAPHRPRTAPTLG